MLKQELMLQFMKRVLPRGKNKKATGFNEILIRWKN